MLQETASASQCYFRLRMNQKFHKIDQAHFTNLETDPTTQHARKHATIVSQPRYWRWAVRWDSGLFARHGVPILGETL